MMTSFTITVPVDHASFAGHFPGHPILPGVVLLDYALQSIARKRHVNLSHCELSIVKFLHTVSPGDELLFELDTASATLTKFTIRCGTNTVATGTVKHPAVA
jgi:3-hydroxymyristoyl/3-hydroxydecanoyl-(acyl carrier protein) dehydratase